MRRVDRIDAICRISTMAAETGKPRQLLIATRNAHKTEEFARILGPRFAVRDLTSAGAELPEIEETGSTFEENAKLKAVGISKLVPDLVLADDSGLEVVALGGAPGVYSARYAGAAATDADNVRKLLQELHDSPATNRQAQFRCVLVAAKRGDLRRVVEGTVSGRIADAPRGNGGFGYDPVFVPEGYDATFGELPAEVKNSVSHRARAVAELAQFLRGGADEGTNYGATVPGAP
jgi:XTP/dITP diphosphohydrolase